MRGSALKKMTVTIDGCEMALHVYRERRRNIRMSFGTKGLILRIPVEMLAHEEREHLERVKVWARRHLNNNASLRDRYDQPSYYDGQLLEVGTREYRLHIDADKRSTSTAALQGRDIHITTSEELDSYQQQRTLSTLISRVVAQDFKPEIERRLRSLNRKHFRMPIKGVYLKNNRSNWGSCSARDNINLSTRLLFAPEAVQDYVMIHELAHLIEHNHSSRFWDLVRRAMPDYEVHEQWLRDHGPGLNF